MSSFADKWKGYTDTVVVVTRYIGTFAGGIAVALGLAGLSQDDIHNLIEALKQLGTGVSTAMTALGTIGGIAMAAYAAWKTRPQQQVATIAHMPPAAAAQAVASLPPEAQTAIKVAATPDSVLIKAVTAMPDVTQITVKDNATDGVAIAAADPKQPKVVTETDAKGAA